jgi:hypothetical protein
MSGKIDKNGYLALERKGVLKKVCCPFTVSSRNGATQGVYCGDWCPFFGDPYKEGCSTVTILEICHGESFYFGNFEDDREEIEEKCKWK